MKILFLTATALLLAGCSSFTTNQRDISYDAKGAKVREITTKVAVTTVFDANSALAKSKAINTDKSQSAELGALTQQSTSTNVIAALQAVSSIISQIK